MRKLICLLLCLLLCGCTAPTQTDGYSFTDSTGCEVRVGKNPEPVAVLLSSLADVWVTAGGEVDITVGETLERGFAEDTAVLVDSGAGKTIDLERLVAAKPDLVLYSPDIAGQAECADVLRSAGIPTAGFRVDTFGEYLRMLKICSELTEQPERYQTYGLSVQERINAILVDAQERQEKPDILFVRAGSSAKYTKAKTAENNFVCVMLQELESNNIAEKAPILLDGLSMEEILMCDPDVIFYTTMGAEESAVSYMESLLADPVWSSLTAVKNGKVHHLPKDLFQYKPNSRWNEAYAYLVTLLYGE